MKRSFFYLLLFLSVIGLPRLAAQSPSNRYGTQDLFVIDSIAYNDNGSVSNLADYLRNFAYSHPSDTVAFPGGSVFVASDDLNALVLDSLGVLQNTVTLCGYLQQGPNTTFAILTTSDILRQAETVGGADRIELNLAGLTSVSGVDGPDCRISYAVAQFLPDTLNPCMEDGLGPLELAEHRASLGNYQLLSLNGQAAARCYIRYYWNCQMIWWYPKWPIVWTFQGHVADTLHGIYTTTSNYAPYMPCWGVTSVSPQFASVPLCYYWNDWGDATTNEFFYTIVVPEPMRFYDYSCTPIRPSLPGNMPYNSQSLACHCFWVHCVNEARALPFSVTENGWRYEGFFYTLSREVWTFLPYDIIYLDLSVSHATGMGPSDEFPNAPVYHITRTFSPAGIPGWTNHSSLNVGARSHGQHRDFLYLEEWSMQVDPNLADILDFKICLSAVHAWPRRYCPGLPVVLEPSLVPTTATVAWTGPGNFSSNLYSPVLAPLNAGMVGNYICTGTDSVSQCTFADTLMIDMVDSASIDIVPTTLHVAQGSSINLGCTASLSTVLQGASVPTVYWSDTAYIGAGNTITVSPGGTTTYYAQIVDVGGDCGTIDSVVVVVDSCPSPYFMNLSTGRDASTISQLTPPANDPAYTLVMTDFGTSNLPMNVPVVQAATGWNPGPLGSNWAGNDPQCAQSLQPGGAYHYQRKFSLQQIDPSLSLSLELLADDSAEVFFNGYPVLQCHSPVNSTSTVITDPSMFLQGENTFDIKVYNAPNSFTGFALYAYLQSCSPIFNITEVNPGGLASSLSAVTLQPNPARTTVRVSGLPAGEVFHLTLMDLQGRVCTQQVSPEFDIQDLPAGLYFIRVHSLNASKTLRLVVQR